MLLLVLLFLQSQEIYKVGQGITAPTVIRRVDAEYSPAALSARVQGTVVLETVIGDDGIPKVARVVRSLGYGLDESAIRAVEQWVFRPAMKDGTPVKAAINIEVTFNLAPAQPAQTLPVNSAMTSAAVTTVASDPNHPATFYAATRAGIYKTADGGGSWRSVGSIPNAVVIAVDPQNSSTVYASNRAGLFKSIDGGETWNSSQPMSAREIRFDPRNPNVLYVTNERGISKSIDRGESWTDVLPGNFTTFLITGADTILAISDSGGLYSTTDAGTHWQFIGSNLNRAEHNTAPAVLVPTKTVTFTPFDAIDNSLAAPELMSPPDGDVFSNFPRQVTLRWAKSPNAASYIVEWDYGYNGVWHLEDQRSPEFGFPVRATEYTFEFLGAQPGRWRVFPVNAAGQRGAPSEWRTFRFTK